MQFSFSSLRAQIIGIFIVSQLQDKFLWKNSTVFVNSQKGFWKGAYRDDLVGTKNVKSRWVASAII